MAAFSVIVTVASSVALELGNDVTIDVLSAKLEVFALLRPGHDCRSG
ncbi:hypothetical protein ACFQY3_18165 [Paenibacillus farraposensis]